MADDDTNGSFLRDRRMILFRLEQIERDLSQAMAQLQQLQVKLVELRTSFDIRAGLWGAMAGALPGLLAAGIGAYWGKP